MIKYLILFILICIDLRASSRLIAVGDILLSRNVEKEIKIGINPNPWSELSFPADASVLGNFEGAVGTSEKCDESLKYCFHVQASRIELLRNAGFTHLGLENNHANDLGPAGKAASLNAFEQSNLTGLTFDQSPFFLRKNGITVAIISFDLTNGPTPLSLVRRKIRLAKPLADWVVLFIHWGEEFLTFPSSKQKALAKDFTSWGADVIWGHHPHVIQSPACVNGRPVYFSLGNHLFDQRNASTHRGLAIDCEFNRSNFSCQQRGTIRSAKSTLVNWEKRLLPALACESVKKNVGPRLHWKAETTSKGNIFMYLDNGFEIFRSTAPAVTYFSPFYTANKTETFFIGHMAHSNFDKRVALRPAVYVVNKNKLRPIWKGTTLAYPPEDFEILGDKKDFLCVWHEKNGYFLDKPTIPSDRLMAYEWNGFGFSKDRSPVHQAECQKWARSHGYVVQ